jgi:2'-5' RNA ligase
MWRQIAFAETGAQCGEARQRLFFALWPDEAVRSQIAAVVGEVSVRGGKAVPLENLHITLVFLGDVDRRTRALAETLGDRIAAPSFALQLDRIGFWPRPGLLWLGTSALPEQLAVLAAELHQGIAACGVKLDARPFLAHVTLMRKVRVVQHAGTVGPVDWQVPGFALVESIPTPAGSRYRVIRTWPLQAGRG